MFWRDTTAKIKVATDMYAAYQAGTLKVEELIKRRICDSASEGKKIECQVVTECFKADVLMKLVADKVKELAK